MTKNRRLNPIPPGWAMTTLNEVATWGSGGTPSRKNPNYYDGAIPWIKTGELGPKYIRKTEEHISDEAIQRSSAKVFKAGSIGIAMYGATIGKLSIFGIDASTNQACAVAQPQTEILDKELLYYFLLSEKRNFIEAGKGGAQPNISQGVLKSWRFPLPPVNEQQRIVAKIEALLSELDKGVESLETAREQLKVYRQAVLKQAFEGKLTDQWRRKNKDRLENPPKMLKRLRQEREACYRQQLSDWETAVRAWEVTNKDEKRPIKPKAPTPFQEPTPEELAELPDLPDGWIWVRPEDIAAQEEYAIGIGPFGSNLKVSDYRENGIPLIFVRNITRSDFSRDLKYIDPIKYAELIAHSVKPLDLLITKMGDPPGDCEIYPVSSPEAVLTADCLKFRLWEKYGNRKFYKNCINSSLVRRQLGLITKGVAQKKISTARFKTILIPFLCIDEQQIIAEQLDDVFSIVKQQEQAISESLQKAEALRQSILKKAFSGQLVPQDPDDEPASVLLERIRMEKEAKSETNKHTSKRQPRSTRVTSA